MMNQISSLIQEIFKYLFYLERDILLFYLKMTKFNKKQVRISTKLIMFIFPSRKNDHHG
jgi:hypothetical protein